MFECVLRNENHHKHPRNPYQKNKKGKKRKKNSWAVKQASQTATDLQNGLCSGGVCGAWLTPPTLVRPCVLSHVWLFATPWTIARQAPLSIGLPRQEYWNELSFPPPGDLPDPGIEPVSPTPPALAGRFFTIESPGKLGSVSDEQNSHSANITTILHSWWAHLMQKAVENISVSLDPYWLDKAPLA